MNGLSIQDVEYHMDDSRIPTVFPDQWVKSCVHSQRNRVLSRWLLMESFDIISDTLKNAADKAPTNVSGKIIIGAVSNNIMPISCFRFILHHKLHLFKCVSLQKVMGFIILALRLLKLICQVASI